MLKRILNIIELEELICKSEKTRKIFSPLIEKGVAICRQQGSCALAQSHFHLLRGQEKKNEL